MLSTTNTDANTLFVLPFEIQLNILLYLSNDDLHLIDQLNKNIWHENHFYQLQKFLQENNQPQLENTITWLYLNLKFTTELLASTSDDIYNKWFSILKKILASTCLTPVYRAIIYVVLLQYIESQKPSSVSDKEKIRLQTEFEIQLYLLQEDEPLAVKSIQLYHQSFFIALDRNSKDIKNYAGPDIRKTFSSTNYTAILLKPYIDVAPTKICSKLAAELFAKVPQDIVNCNLISYIYSYLKLSKTDAKAGFLESLKNQNFDDKFLLKAKYDEYRNQVAYIVSQIWLSSPRRHLILKMHTIDDGYLDKIRKKVNDYSSLYSDAEILHALMIAICHLLNNNKNEECIELFEAVSFDVFNCTVIEKNFKKEKIITALSHVFRQFSIEAILSYIDLTLINFLKDAPTTYAEILGNALARQGGAITRIIVNQLLTTQCEDEENNTVHYAYLFPYLANLTAILLHALPAEEQIFILKKNIIPLLNTENHIFAVNCLVQLLRKNVSIGDVNDPNCVIKLINPHNSLAGILQKDKQLAGQWLIIMKSSFTTNGCIVKYKDLMEAIVATLLILNSNDINNSILDELITLIEQSATLHASKLTIDAKLHHFKYVKEDYQFEIYIHFIHILAVILGSKVSSSHFDRLYKLYSKNCEKIYYQLLARLLKNESDEIRHERIKTIRSALSEMMLTAEDNVEIINLSSVFYTLFSRNICMLLTYYQSSLTDHSLWDFIDLNADMLNCDYVESLAEETLIALTTHVNIDMQKKIFNILKHKEDDIKDLIRFMPSFNADQIIAAIETLWEHIRTRGIKSETVMEFYAALPSHESQAYMIKMTFNSGHLTTYHFIQDFIKNALPISFYESSVREIFLYAIDLIAKKVLHTELILDALVANKNPEIVIENFETILKFIGKFNGKACISKLLSPTLRYLDDEKLQLLSAKLKKSTVNKDNTFDNNFFLFANTTQQGIVSFPGNDNESNLSEFQMNK